MMQPSLLPYVNIFCFLSGPHLTKINCIHGFNQQFVVNVLYCAWVRKRIQILHGHPFYLNNYLKRMPLTCVVYILHSYKHTTQQNLSCIGQFYFSFIYSSIITTLREELYPCSSLYFFDSTNHGYANQGMLPCVAYPN